MRGILSRLENTKIVFVFVQGSALEPAGGAYSATFDPLRDISPHSSPNWYLQHLSLGISVRAPSHQILAMLLPVAP